MNLKAIRWYILASLACFIALKLSLWPVVFVFPFCIYQIIKLSRFWWSGLLSFVLGFAYFGALLIWNTTIGIELSLYGAFCSGIVFGLSALIFKTLETKILNLRPALENWLFLVWLVIFWAAQMGLFPIMFADAPYLLDIPVFLPMFYSEIGSSGVRTILWAVSIWWGQSLFVTRQKGAVILSTLMVMILGVSHAWLTYSSSPSTDQTDIKVALIQTEHEYEVSEKVMNAVALFERYKEKVIEVAKQDADIIILPENAIMFWGPQLEVPAMIAELEVISKEYDAYIIFSTLQPNDRGKIESQGYLIDPDLGNRDIYIAQKTYNYIGQEHQFELGTKTIVYPTRYGGIRHLICFEALFRDEIQKPYVDEYDYIVITASNQFMPSSQGIETLRWNAQDLAATYGKQVLYASNTGPTLFVDSEGKITDQIRGRLNGVLWGYLEKF